MEQMLSIKAGVKIYGRLQDLCDGKIIPEQIAQLTDKQIKSIVTSNFKVSFICSLTNKVIAGELKLEVLETLADEEVYKKLLFL